jgi:catechol 2,3-dioxygenase
MSRPHFLSQLGHVELISPKPEETVTFFRDVIGMVETAREGQSVYLRAWGDTHKHTLKITEGPETALGHIGWRADSAEALGEVAKFLEDMGAGIGWIEGDNGHGPAYRFRSPDGHIEEVFWEVERYEAPPELRSVWKNRPSKNMRKGISPRRLDHVTIQSSTVTADREFYQKLGFKYHEGIYVDRTMQKEMGAWLSVSNLSHDIAVVRDPRGERGQLNHVCYAVESREEVLLAADHIIESGYRLEMGGPTRHALAEGFFFYVLEPGGHRFELYAGAHLIFDVDYPTKIWFFDEDPNDAWGGKTPWNPDGSQKEELTSEKVRRA